MVKVEYKQTEVGIIPADWEICLLGKYSDVFRGGSPRPIQAYLTNASNGLNWIKIGDVKAEDKYITSTQEKIIPEGLSKTREVHCGDLLLSNSMSFGRPYILKIDGCIHDGWLTIQNYESAFDSDFLYYYLSSDMVTSQYVSMAAGSGVQNLNKEKVATVSVVKPEISEQKEIATALSDIDKLIANLEKLISKKKAIKQGVMGELLTGKRRLPEFEGEWVYTQLREVLKIYNGYAFKSSTYDNVAGIYNVITIANVQQGQMNTDNCNKIAELPSDIQRHQLLNIGDLLISMTGNVGRVCSVNKEKCLLNQRVGKIVVFENHNKEFIYHALNTSNFLNAMILSAKGGAQPNLSTNDIYDYLFTCPPTIEEERAIATLLNDMQSEIINLENSLKKYYEIKSGMMSELLSGRIRLINKGEE